MLKIELSKKEILIFQAVDHDSFTLIYSTCFLQKSMNLCFYEKHDNFSCNWCSDLSLCVVHTGFDRSDWGYVYTSMHCPVGSDTGRGSAPLWGCLSASCGWWKPQMYRGHLQEGSGQSISWGQINLPLSLSLRHTHTHKIYMLTDQMLIWLLKQPLWFVGSYKRGLVKWCHLLP